MALPQSVVIGECWARDGLQSISRFIPTHDKIEMIHRIQKSGVKKIEVTSFAHPKLLPQFSDCVEVLQGVRRSPDLSYVVLIPNRKGFERFELCQKRGYGADEIILMISASEKHNQLNFKMTLERAKEEYAPIMKRAKELGVKIIGCIGTVYGCPVMGDLKTEQVSDVVRYFLNEGADFIMLGDSTGMANPLLVRSRLSELQNQFPKAEWIAHFHDTRGTGILNSITAIEMGVRYVDTSIGAIGGQPATGAGKYSLGYTGNTCSEDLAALLDEMGVETGIDIEEFIATGQRAEEILSKRLRSNVVAAGPVLHGPSAVNKEI